MLQIKLGLFYILIYYLRHTIPEAKFPKENKNYSMKRPCYDWGISGLSVKTEARGRTLTITSRICGGEMTLRQDFIRKFQFPAKGFCSSTSGISLPVPFNQCSIIVYHPSVTEAVRI